MYALLSIFQTISDLGFVIKILIFAYVLYWLFIVFREQQIVLGLAAIIASYFMFFHSISILVLVLLFFVFIVMSMHFQFIIDMGLVPILGMLGFHDPHQGDVEQIKMQEIQKKLSEGEGLSSEEVDLFRKVNEKNTHYEQQAQKLLSGGFANYR